MLRVEQWVDRVNNPGGLTSPDGEVGLRQVGQQKRDGLTWAQAQAMKGVSGLGDLAQQLPVGEAVSRLISRALEDKRQSRCIHLPRGAAVDQLVGAGRQVALGQRGLLDLADVAQGLDRRDVRHRRSHS